MVRASTLVILLGIGLLLFPVPPVATAGVGVLVVLAGVALRVFADA